MLIVSDVTVITPVNTVRVPRPRVDVRVGEVCRRRDRFDRVRPRTELRDERGPRRGLFGHLNTKILDTVCLFMSRFSATLACPVVCTLPNNVSHL
jgi:hypothetical protein